MVETLPAGARVAEIVALVNAVYEESERELWLDGAVRTTPDEIESLLAAGELAGIVRGDRLAGVVHVHAHDEHTGGFGMLAADPALRGQGIGRDLVAHAESAMRAAGRRVMQLELLLPRETRLASKEFLAAWYERLGYRVTRVGALEDLYPALKPWLAVPADYRIYHKALI